MSTTTKNKRNKSKRNSKNISEVRKQSREISAHGLQRRVRRKLSLINTGGIATSCFLNHPLTVKSPFLFDNKEKLVYLLPKLYNCLKQSDKFIDDKEWDTLPTIPELADYLFGKIKTIIPEGYEWMIPEDNYNDEHGVVINYYKHANISDDYFGCPLEWLPEIEKKNLFLYTLICSVISKISETCEVELIYTKYDEYFIYDPGFRETGDEASDELNNIEALRYQKGGDVYKLYKDIKVYRDFTFDELYYNINNFKTRGKLQSLIKTWLQVGLKVLENPPILSNYMLNYEGEHSDGKGLNISDALQFVFSFHDQVFENVEQFKNDIYNNSGYINPVEFGSFTETKHIPVIPASESIEVLIEFLKQGRYIYFNFYEDKFKAFYDKRRNDYGV